METKNIINKLTNSIVFKNIEEEAINSYKQNYKESPLELLFVSKHDLNYEGLLSSESFNKSISIYHCLLKIRSTYHGFKTICFNNFEEKDLFKANAKYIDYLYYNKECIEIEKLHKLLSTKNFSIKYIDLFGYLILDKLYDQNSYKKFSEFIIFYIAKLDDEKMPFYKKWDPILSAINTMCLNFFNKSYDNFVDGLMQANQITNKNKSSKNKSSKIKFGKGFFTSTPISGSNSYTAYSNMFNQAGFPLKNAVKLDFWKVDPDQEKEADEFFISIIKAFIKYIYNLISLKNKQYDFFKCLLESDYLFRSFKKYKRYYYDSKIGTLSALSNFDSIKNGLNAHKSNLKLIKSFLTEFNDQSIEQLEKDKDIFTFIIFDNYFLDFQKFFDKYLEKVKKINIRT